MNSTSSLWLERLSRWGKNTAIVVALATGVASLASLTWNFTRFVNSQLERDRMAKIAQLTNYSTFGIMLKRYNEISKLTYKFLGKNREDPLDQSKLDLLLSKYKTGSAIYYSSQELADFAEIVGFYEDVGTLIRYEAINFDLAYELVTFPTDFFEETKPIADFIGNNWFGKNRDLPDFLLNVKKLAQLYEDRRQKK